MKANHSGTVVVGVDGTDASLAALRWAAREAQLRRRRLRVVYAFPPPAFAGTMGLPAHAWPGAKLRRPAVDALNDLVAHVRRRTPGLPVGGFVLDAVPAAALQEESRNAVLVVLGAGRSGGLTGLRLGSVSNHVAMHASCPVVVVPAGHDPAAGGDRDVVVGVDGSWMADAATEFAVAEAEQRGVRLVAVHAWTPPHGVSGEHLARLEAAEHDRLTAAVRRRRPAERHVDVDHRVLAGSPASGLLAAARDAQLLVIGSRGTGELRGMLLGSVGLQLLHRVACPLAVVHPHRHAAELSIADQRASARAARPALA